MGAALAIVLICAFGTPLEECTEKAARMRIEFYVKSSCDSFTLQLLLAEALAVSGVELTGNEVFRSSCIRTGIGKDVG